MQVKKLNQHYQNQKPEQLENEPEIPATLVSSAKHSKNSQIQEIGHLISCDKYFFQQEQTLVYTDLKWYYDHWELLRMGVKKVTEIPK